MEDGFETPSPAELQWTDDLVGHRISIFWDGDQYFYPCLVTRYDANRDRFFVLYENDASNLEYVENLRKAAWKICRRTARLAPELIPHQVNAFSDSSTCVMLVLLHTRRFMLIECLMENFTAR